MSAINDEWIIMGIKQMQIFEKDNEAYMHQLVKGTTLLELWQYIYAKAVALKVLIPIENAPKEYKERIWLEANDLAKGKMKKEELIRLSRALYTMKDYAD